jgi:hypothetical protein
MVLFGTYYGTNRLEGVLHRPPEPARVTGNLGTGTTANIAKPGRATQLWLVGKHLDNATLQI